MGQVAPTPTGVGSVDGGVHGGGRAKTRGATSANVTAPSPCGRPARAGSAGSGRWSFVEAPVPGGSGPPQEAELGTPADPRTVVAGRAWPRLAPTDTTTWWSVGGFRPRSVLPTAARRESSIQARPHRIPQRCRNPEPLSIAPVAHPRVEECGIERPFRFSRLHDACRPPIRPPTLFRLTGLLTLPPLGNGAP